jgi:hypothetical protein
MSPRPARFNFMDSSWRYCVTTSQGSTRGSTREPIFYLGHLSIRKFCMRVVNSSTLSKVQVNVLKSIGMQPSSMTVTARHQSKTSSVLRVLLVSNPFKVLWDIVGLYSVFVIADVLGWARTNECFSHQSMNELEVIKTYGVIPVPSALEFAQSRSSISETFFDATHASTVGDLVTSFPTSNRLPNFSGIIEHIHGGFLSYRNRLWLGLKWWFTPSLRPLY